MPQLMRGVGIDNYIFSRGRPVSIDLEQGWHREFIWAAPDGSRVYALPLSTSYTAGMFLPGLDEPEALRRRIEEVLEAERHSHRPDIALLPHGVDHTWLQQDIPDILRALPEIMPEIEFRQGSLQDAIDEWKRAVPDDLRQYAGALRGRLRIDELHGTLSSRMDNKLMNEQAQMHLENLAEPLHALAVMFGRPSTPWFFKKAWQRVFHNHAHDSICGCSQDRVHAEVNVRFREVIELGCDIADSALDYLNSPARRDAVPTLIVYAGLNGGHSLVDFVIKLQEKPGDACCFTDENGTDYRLQWEVLLPLRVQHTNGCVDYWECRGCVYIPELMPGEVRKLVFQAGREAAMPVDAVSTIAPAGMANGLLQVLVNGNGALDLLDLETGACVKNTHYFAQDGDCGGGYHFEPIPKDRRRDTRATAATTTVLQNGPLRAQIEVKTALRVPARYDRQRSRRTGQCTVPVCTTLTLEADSRLLKCHTRIDNTARHQRIRLILPSGLATQTVHADASFAIHQNTASRWPSEPGQNSHPMRNMVSIHENGTGLAFLGKGLHEYAIVPGADGTQIEVTLLRSVDFVQLCGTWETPEAQLLRTLDYDYALTLHHQAWREAEIPGLTASFRNPPIALMHGDFAFSKEREAHATTGFYVRTEIADLPVDSNRSTWKPYNADRDGWRRVEPSRFVQGEIPARMVPFTLHGRHLVVSAFKACEDGQGRILRFWSYGDALQTVTVVAHSPRESLIPCNLLEQPLPSFKPAIGSMTIAVKPFEIVTLRVGACDPCFHSPKNV